MAHFSADLSIRNTAGAAASLRVGSNVIQLRYVFIDEMKLLGAA